MSQASEAHGYGSLSYLSKSHAVLIVRNVDMEKNITEIENIVAGVGPTNASATIASTTHLSVSRASKQFFPSTRPS